MDNAHPLKRISSDVEANLKLVSPMVLPDDTKKAFEANFQPELLQIWPDIEECVANAWISLHELRSNQTDRLLSARLLCHYPARRRGESAFVLAGWSVTPDNCDGNIEQGKGKGYGSYLLEQSIRLIKQQHPHLFALVSERESGDSDQAKRKRWMSHNGLRSVERFEYEIPGFPDATTGDALVQDRQHKSRHGNLLLRRFDGADSVSSKELSSIVERLYSIGYSIKSDDPFMVEMLKRTKLSDEFALEPISCD